MPDIYNLAQPLIAGQPYEFPATVGSVANAGKFQTGVTLAAGDVTFSVDGGGFANLALPVEVGATGELTTTITAGNSAGATKYITVKFSDAAGDEWNDTFYIILVMEAVDVPSAVDIWSYATRTLTSFGTLAVDIWSYATRTLTVGLGHLKTSVLGTTIEILRGDTLIINITKLGNISERDEIWFTVKSDLDDTDATAQIQITETGGLLYIAGGTATEPLNGRITVLDATRGNIRILMSSSEAAKLSNDWLGYFDVQVQTGTNTATLRYGNAKILGDVTRSTTGSGIIAGPWWLGPWPDYDATIPPIAASAVIAAYQPKFIAGIYIRGDPASYANSLLNIANPGTNNAITGVAPTWSTVSGWTGTGTQWLDTGIPGGTDQTGAVFAAYHGAGINAAACGSYNILGVDEFSLRARLGGAPLVWANNSARLTHVAAGAASGVMGLSGNVPYLNGTNMSLPPFGISIPAFGGINTADVHLLGTNANGAPAPTSIGLSCWVRYSITITDAQAKAVQWAMEHIRAA